MPETPELRRETRECEWRPNDRHSSGKGFDNLHFCAATEMYRSQRYVDFRVELVDVPDRPQTLDSDRDIQVFRFVAGDDHGPSSVEKRAEPVFN